MKHSAIALMRLSTEEQAAEGKGGLLRQQEEIRIAAQRWNLGILETYEIIDVSGTQVSESPIFKEMLEKLEQPSIRGLVLPAIDRLMRPDNFESFSIYSFFLQHHKYIWTPSSQIDVAEDSGFLEAIMQGVMAGLDRRRILRNTQTAKEAKRKLGRCANAKITLPQGVDFDFTTGKWSYVEPYASRIREAFTLFLSGSYSIKHIAKMLNYKSDRTLYNQLRNPIWCGIREYRYRRGNEKYPSTDGRQSDRKKVLREDPLRVKMDIAPLIPEEFFQRAQEMLETRRGEWKSSRSNGSRFESSGLLYCSCGQRMYSKSGRHGTKGDFYYCRSRHSGSGCGSPNANRAQIDYTISSFLANFLLKPETFEPLLRMANERQNTGNLISSIEKANMEINLLKEKKKKLLRSAIVMNFSEDEIESEAKQINSELAAWMSILRKAEKELDTRTVSNTKEMAQNIASVFSEFEYLRPFERKSFLQRFISRVEIAGNSISSIRLQVPSLGTKTCSRTGRDSSQRPA
jgi:DNA invertase Pin-like site-specific DNA recombinase/FtsZ-binding cell division protein ZapB